MVSQNHKSFKDSPPARYRTSNFPMFPDHQMEGLSILGNTTMQYVNSSIKKEDVVDVPRKHEGPKLLQAQQPKIVKKNLALTSDAIDDGSMEILEKRKLEKMMNDVGQRKDSGDKYRGHIPTLVKVRQKPLPPVTKPQHMTRQTSMAAAIDKRKSHKTAENLKVTKKSSTKTDHVQTRDIELVYNKPRFQGGPYEAKPYKLLPPIATKTGEKKPTKEKVHDGEAQNKRKPAFIAVRHTKKSAQIESRAKAKLDAEKAAIQEALIKVKQPLASIATKLASKTQSTASGFTASDWSTTCIASSSPQSNESSVSVPPISQLAHTFNAALAKSIDTNADKQASVNVPACPHSSSARESSLSRSSKVSQSIGLTKPGRDHGSRPHSVSSARSNRSAERSARTPQSKRSSSSRVPSPCTSSQNSLTVRSAPTGSPSPNGVKKSARLSTHGSCKSMDMADDRNVSRNSSTSKSKETIRGISRRSRRDGRSTSPSPRGSMKSSRCSPPGSARSKKKVKPDKSGPNASEHSDDKSDCSPLSTARSSANSSRPSSVSSNSASTSRSVSERSRNASRMKSEASSRGSSSTSKMSNNGLASPVKRDRSRESSPSKYCETVKSVSRRSRRDGRSTSPSPCGSMKSSRRSQPGSARSKMKVKSDKSGPNASEHSDDMSDCSPLSTARSSARSSRPASVSSGSVITSRPSTALSRPGTAINRPNTAPMRRPSTALSHTSSASDRQHIASSHHSVVSARHSNISKSATRRPSDASVHPNTARDRPKTVTVRQRVSSVYSKTDLDRQNATASVRPKTALVRPSTAPNRQGTTSAWHSTASTSHSTASIHQIPLSDRSITRIKASPINTSSRSSNSICSVTPLPSNRSSSRTSTILSNRS